MPQPAKADVIWWDNRYITVRCPFCDHNHHHSRIPGSYSREVRMSPCDSLIACDHNKRYQPVFPYDAQGKPVYEIDKSMRRFVAIEIKADDNSNVDELASSFKAISLSKEEGGVISAGNRECKKTIGIFIPTAAPQYYGCFSSYTLESRSEIYLTGTILRVPVPEFRKTIAHLLRGSPFPGITAMSGWGHESSETISIAGRTWTEKVLSISKEIGHQLESSFKCDRGRPGRFRASHAEKQLIAYFIEKHFIRPCERDLFGSPPPVGLTEATIIVTQEPCDDCREFTRRIALEYKLDIELIFCPYSKRVKGRPPRSSSKHIGFADE